MKAIQGSELNVELSAYLESVKDIEKFSEAPAVSTNPFRSRLKSSITIKNKKIAGQDHAGVFEVIDADGVVEDGIKKRSAFYKERYVDSEAFVKIYLNRFRDMLKLSLSAIKVFNYFLGEMQKPENINKDQLYFNVKDCMEFCDYSSHAMVYNGLTELISHGFVAKSDKPYIIYVDSNVAFNGDRILVFEEYIRKDANYFDDKSLNE